MKQTNPELQLAGEYVRHTDCNVFLTGRAGTGKTTFLHAVSRDTPKRSVVTAPTIEVRCAGDSGVITLLPLRRMQS
ncbi:MAG: hypothetical protein K9M82_13520 [Deltaproteobacteria bacterium]|nr:hypothetical protein [Deltaproteobacteria bacterium]